MTGIVKKKSVLTGRHFVFCQDISDVYGKDVQIPMEEEPDGVTLQCGDRISFEVDEPEEGSDVTPLARNVRVIQTRGGGVADASALADRRADTGDGEDECDEDVDVDEEPD